MNPAKVPKSLNILTIDGGGLQALSTLLILNRILETIGERNSNPPRKSKPCEVFDTIVGIGTGGWLAILLGRFRMDITSCLSEWYTMLEYIKHRSKSGGPRLPFLHHPYYDLEGITERIDRLTQIFGIGDILLEDDPEGARTRHVFVAALKSDAKSYGIFRTYEVPKSAKLPAKLWEGPKNPATFKISSAFGVTGATQYLTKEWQEDMEHSGPTSFLDRNFPKPHDITKLALNEMWAIYGADVPVSLIVNVGPDLPNRVDVNQITRKFPRNLDPFGSSGTTSTKRAGLTKPKQELPIPSTKPAIPPTQPDEIEHATRKLSIKAEGSGRQPTAKGDQAYSTPLADLDSHESGSPDKNSSQAKDNTEQDTTRKSSSNRPESGKTEFHFAIPEAPPGTTLTDSPESMAVHNATMSYLDQPSITCGIDEVARLALGSMAVV